jgi:uncharacterized protein YoxC
VIALASLTVLCIYLVIVLSSLRRDLADFAQRSKPVLDNLAFITEKLKSTAQKIDDHVDIVKSSLTSCATKVRFFEWDETAMAKAKLAVWKNPA